jgi:CelD/BcsL family acetyltransferase involved in cellulose biosynthesis
MSVLLEEYRSMEPREARKSTSRSQRMRLEPLSPAEIAQWDSTISAFPQRQVFHRQAWLECLAETQEAEWRYWAVTLGGSRVGYFCAGIVEKGPFRILGSPLRSWHTNYLGPLLYEGVDSSDFVAALEQLAEEERISVVELEYPCMPHAAYEAAGFSYHQTWTNQLPLLRDHRQMMQRMSKGRKHGIRKAVRCGLEVIDDESAGDRLYDQLSRALRRRGAICPFPQSFPRAIVKYLRPQGLLYTLGVRNEGGEVVATGLFPFDNGTVYLWDTSSEVEGRDQHPNDLLHWELMCRAADQGLTLYDMSGYGRFNNAFGPQLVPTFRWYKSYSTAARWARGVYEQYLRFARRPSFVSYLLDKIGR